MTVTVSQDDALLSAGGEDAEAEASAGPMRRVWLQIAHTSGARIYSLIAGLVVLTITARWLGPAGRGQMAAALVWANVFYLCSYCSLNYVAMHQASVSAGDRSWLPSMMGTLFVFAGGMSLLGWIVAAILWFWSAGSVFGAITPPVLVVALLTVPFLILEQYANGLLLGMGRLDVYNRALVTAKTIVLALVGIFFYLRFGIVSAVSATLIGQIGISMAGMPVVFRAAGGVMRFDGALLARMLKRGLQLHPSNAAMYLYGYSSVLLINHYLGAAQTGLYHMAMQLVDVMLVLPIAGNLVLFSKASSVGPSKVWPFQRRILVGMLVLMTFACIAAAILAPILIPFVVGKAFTPSVRIFRRLLIVAWVGTIVAVMMPQWITRGYFAAISAVNVCAVIINVTAGFVLIKRFGINGIIVATILGYSTTAIASIVLAVRCELEYRRGLAS
jgi:O-antigen/teichoic acid export membrane protein